MQVGTYKLIAAGSIFRLDSKILTENTFGLVIVYSLGFEAPWKTHSVHTFQQDFMFVLLLLLFDLLLIQLAGNQIT